MTPIDRLIAVAEAEIGYLEKKSNRDLDDKTANAGSANYTRYNRDMKAWAGSTDLNDQWCQNFVDWCFVTAFGLETAKKLLYTFTNYTPTGSNAFRRRNRYVKRGSGKPKRGDVIYFYSSAKKRIGHVGIVCDVSSSKVYTIEGNTSGASSLVTNGGGVRRKSYSLSSTYIDGYGSVDYSAVGTPFMASDPAPASASSPETGDPGLRYGAVGEAVTAMQRLLLVWDPHCLPGYGADGDFGSETLAALQRFQISAGLAATGIYDADTERALKAVGVPQCVLITGGRVNLRSAPGTAAGAVLAVSRAGDRLPWQGETRNVDGRDWYLVEHDNRNAWVSSKYARISEP